MRAVLIKNRYYSDSGSEYVLNRIKEELALLGVASCVTDAFSVIASGDTPDFAVFWDKDYDYARLLEKRGIKLFNSADSIRICDDKFLTYCELSGEAESPYTLCAPLMYETCNSSDKEFLQNVETLGFPLIAKYCVGSLGSQVFKIDDKERLNEFSNANRHKRHLYQRFVACSAGEDIRVYTVGGKAIATVKRRNADSFKSNSSDGSQTFAFTPPEQFVQAAERISRKLGLEYCAVDFFADSAPLLVEVNSNAYFKEAESAAKVNIAAAYAKRMTEVVKCCGKR